MPQIIHLYAHFCSYCVLFVWTSASVHYSIIQLYCNNIKKPYREKRRILLAMWGSIDRHWSAKCLGIFFDNILGRFDVVLKSRVGGGDSNTPTISSCFLARHWISIEQQQNCGKLNLWKIRIRELNSWHIYYYSLQLSCKWTP